MNLKIYLSKTNLQGQVIAKRNLLQRPGIPEGIKEFYFNLQGFNQYGLLHDDVLHETEIVTKAISRLAPQIQVFVYSLIHQYFVIYVAPILFTYFYKFIHLSL